MKLLQNLLKLLLMLVLVGYLGYIFVSVGRKGVGELCTGVRVEIADSLHAGFITPAIVEEKLLKIGLDPRGHMMDSINSLAIEEKLLKDPFIREVECYKTPGGLVHIIVTQRIPVLRVMADNGQNYYLDEKGYKMLTQGYEADLVVVTGAVDDKYAQKYLVPLGLLIRHDDFWDDQIEQINVLPNKKIQIFTRVGDHIIDAGTPVNMERKLRNLHIFYSKVLSEVGWNRYKEISIAYDNQVVCKK